MHTYIHTYIIHIYAHYPDLFAPLGASSFKPVLPWLISVPVCHFISSRLISLSPHRGKCRLSLQAPKHLVDKPSVFFSGPLTHTLYFFSIYLLWEDSTSWRQVYPSRKCLSSFLTDPPDSVFTGQRIVTSFPYLTKRFFDKLGPLGRFPLSYKMNTSSLYQYLGFNNYQSYRCLCRSSKSCTCIHLTVSKEAHIHTYWNKSITFIVLYKIFTIVSWSVRRGIKEDNVYTIYFWLGWGRLWVNTRYRPQPPPPLHTLAYTHTRSHVTCTWT